MAGGENLGKDIGTAANADLIETNIWLGNLAAATDKKLLEENKIKYILTVNSFPLPKEITDLSYVTTKYIKVYDTSRDDLLSHFEDTYEFIEQSVKKGAVLIHCYLGVSRSGTVLVSYLMKKKKLTLNAALKEVKSKRECTEPNPGFLAQLKLYEIMHWTLDKANTQYKMFRLYITANLVKIENFVPEHCADIIKTDPMLLRMNKDPIVFKCRKCSLSVETMAMNITLVKPFGQYRSSGKLITTETENSIMTRVLAKGSNVIPHAPGEKYSWRDSRWSDFLGKTQICELTYFIEPLGWMENVSVSLEGKLYCPNAACRNKLGSFSWVTGCQCPCNSHICPGFYLIPSKVDKQCILKNTER